MRRAHEPCDVGVCDHSQSNTYDREWGGGGGGTGAAAQRVRGDMGGKSRLVQGLRHRSEKKSLGVRLREAGAGDGGGGVGEETYIYGKESEEQILGLGDLDHFRPPPPPPHRGIEH